MDSLIQAFRDIRFALRKDEVWRDVDFGTLLDDDMTVATAADCQPTECYCNIPNLETVRLTLVNGFGDDTLTTTPQGVVYGSLRAARAQRPDLVDKAMGRYLQRDGQQRKANAYDALNASHFSDGIFIYVPDNVAVAKPFQIQSISRTEHALFLQSRNVVTVGKGSRVSIINCDDSYGMSRSLSNNVTEIVADDNSTVYYYKLQNMNDLSGILNHTYATLGEGSTLRAVAMLLNGGHIRNHTEVRMLGTDAHTEVHGLYLMDKEQQADNYVFVEHARPHCYSHELFKGIMDDSAHGTFNGHVLVCDGAAKTEAFQSNKNILLTDKANIVSKPFLEIYNDDVKCSHGSTTGQIDVQQMFYIRSRGISEHTARTMLLYAFCDEVIQKIDLPLLRNSLSDMVKKRLHGELTVCSDCALNCGTPCVGQSFTIDPDKL